MEIMNKWSFEFDTSVDADWQKFLTTLGKNGDSRIRGFYHKKNPLKKDDRGSKATLNKTTIEEWQRKGYGVYVVIGNGGDEDAEITDVPAFFIEWDDKPLEEQLNYDWSNFLEPTMVVATINSGHTYWVPDQSVTDIQRWRWNMERLITIFGSDKKVKNPSRVMRLPNCYYADEYGRLVKQIRIERYSGKTYSLEEIEAAIEREEQRLNITVSRKPEAPKTGGGRRGWLTEAGHEQFKRSNARSKEEVISALKVWPPRIPGEGTYDGSNPVINQNGREVCIDYFATAVGCLKAFLYAGVEFEEALELMEEQHPQWDGLRQNLEASGGCGRNGLPIEDNTFWKVAFEQLDWQPNGDEVAQDIFTCPVAEAALTLQQNRITASEQLDLMTVFPKNLALPLKERAETFPVHQSALFAPVCAAVASVVGTRLQVQVKRGHREPFVFWFANVQQISEMKSPVGKETTYLPLVSIGQRDAKRYAKEREEIELEIAGAYAMKKELFTVRKWKLSDPPLYEEALVRGEMKRMQRNIQSHIKTFFAAESCPVDPPRSLTTKDSTLEKLQELLSRRNSTGMLLYFDELARFMEMMNAYRSSGGDRQAFLDLWGGGSIDLHRVGRGHTFKKRTALSMLGYIQPDKLQELLGSELFTAINGGDGFWARWLFCTPQHVPDYYNKLEGDISELMGDLLDKVDRHLADVDDVLTLSEDAQDLFIQTYNGWVDECRDKPSGFQGMSGKLKGYLARFAGLLHVIEWGRSDSEVLPMVISAETMQRAITVCLYYRRQYELVMTNAGTTGIPQWVTKLEQRVQNNNLDEVTITNLVRWRIADDKEDANEKIVKLVDEVGLGGKKKNRQNNWVWMPNATNPKTAALLN